MSEKSVELDGDLAVVWYFSYDSTLEAPKRVHDMATSVMLTKFKLEICVEGGDFWVLDGQPGGERVYLTRYYADGNSYLYDVPADLWEIERPGKDVPRSVWARAVTEAHERACLGRQGGCSCTELRHKIDESGILL